MIILTEEEVKEQKRKASERAKAWNKANPDRFKASLKRYQQKYKKELNDKYRDVRRRNVEAFWHNNPWYRSWQEARQRCTNPKNIGFKWYGGKGIKFLLAREECKSIWERDKAVEMAWPTIDRIDSNGDYCLDNCRFLEHRDNVSRRFRPIPADTHA